MERLSSAEVERFLAEETFFRAAPRPAIERLCEAVLQRHVPKGSTFFSMGQTCDALHFVASGSGLLVKLSPEGRQRLLHRAIPGDMVAAVPFFDGQDYPATFIAESDCLVLSFPRAELLSALGGDPKLSLCLIGGLVERLRKLVALVEQTSFKDVTHRLWDYLVEGSTAASGQDYPRLFQDLPTREQMAMAVGTVREVVSRRLAHLAEEGYIKIEGRRLHLLKPFQ